MGVVKYTPEIIGFIKEINGVGIHVSELTEMVNNRFGVYCTPSQIKILKIRHKIKSIGADGKRLTFTGYPLFAERDNGKGYIEKKIGPNKWILKHVWLWEQAHGKVPKGNMVIFLDNDKTNIRLENLALVTSGESMKLSISRLRFNEPELTKTAIAIVRHDSTIRKRLKNEMGEENYASYCSKKQYEKRKERWKNAKHID
jgi:hypothetical protein